MANNPIPQRVQNFWKKWDVRSFVLFSLVLQAILILLAPFRKRWPQKRITIAVWSAYLLADWVSAFALGLISSSQGNNDCTPPSVPSPDTKNPDLLALWAPFLLLHLGGPDTITAFALEDNELWIRHLVSLLVQLFAAGYIFFLSVPNDLWISTLLMFGVGIIKYAERNRALYLASMSSFRDSMFEKPDPGPNYAKLMDEYWWMKTSLLPTKITMAKEPSNKESTHIAEGVNDAEEDTVLVAKAHKFFGTFKKLLADLIFSFYERDDSRNFFLGFTKAEKPFKVIEIELSFIYDIFYTKAAIIHTIWGYLFRVGCFCLTLIALCLFSFKKKKQMHEIDIIVTYILFVGALILDTIALVMLISSDWTIAQLNKSKLDSNSSKLSFLKSYLSKILTKNIFFRRSRCTTSVSQYNLISFCLYKRNKWVHKMADLFGLLDFLDEVQYKRRRPLSMERTNQKGDEPNQSGKEANPVQSEQNQPTHDQPDEEANEAKEKESGPEPKDKGKPRSQGSHQGGIQGGSDVRSLTPNSWRCFRGSKPKPKENVAKQKDNRGSDEIETPYDLKEFIFEELKKKSILATDVKTTKKICSSRGEYALQAYPYIKHKLAWSFKVEYDESLLLWHIATDLLYNKINEDASPDVSEEREVCKLLSDYILYLLVVQPTTIAAVASIAQIRYRDTCAEAEKFFGRSPPEQNKLKSVLKCFWGYKFKPKPGTLQDASAKLLAVKTAVKPAYVKGDRSKSVLFDAVRLAGNLQEAKGDMWKIMSKVWVELLCFAASHCPANIHAQQVSRGGELVTMVWLLMVHFGLGEQFRIISGHARAKLIVQK